MIEVLLGEHARFGKLSRGGFNYFDGGCLFHINRFAESLDIKTLLPVID